MTPRLLSVVLLATTLGNAGQAAAQRPDTLATPSGFELALASAAGSAMGGLAAMLVSAAVCSTCREDLSQNDIQYFAASTLGAAFAARISQVNQVPTWPRALIGAAVGLPVGIGVANLADRADNRVAWVGYALSQGIVTALISKMGKPKEPER